MDVRLTRNGVKHAINVLVAVWLSPNTVQSVICFTGIFPSLSLLNTHSNTATCTAQIYLSLFKKCISNEKTQGVGVGHGGFRRFCGYGDSVKILKCFFMCVRDGCGDWNRSARQPWRLVRLYMSNSGPPNRSTVGIKQRHLVRRTWTLSRATVVFSGLGPY